MKLTIISDTHMRHEELGPLSGDVLIHCGDFLKHEETETDLDNIDRWFGQQDFGLIVCIGGNHDFALQARSERTTQCFHNAVYLEDSALQYEGVNFYGAPWTPELRFFAFFQDRAGLQKKWDLIPEDTHVLITHTPPYDILDKSSRGLVLGCPLLMRRVKSIAPVLHCFGHVHASAGQETVDGTHFVNAASIRKPDMPLRPPVIIKLD